MVDIQQSNNNVFITLQASAEVLQDRKASESNFIRIIFPDTSVPISYYCNLSSKDETLFECLLLFAAGLPASLMTFQFRCDVGTSSGAKQCHLSIPYKSVESP